MLITEKASYKGFETLYIDNGLLRIGILIEKGADIIEFIYKPKNIDFMWHPSQNCMDYLKSTQIDNEFMRSYIGGWQEILPNGGAACSYKGIDYPFHGEISTVPWKYEIEEENEEKVSIRLIVETDPNPYRLEKLLTLKKNDSTLYIEEKLTNTGNEDKELMWGHHPAIGGPFLTETCRIVAPVLEVKSHPTTIALKSLCKSNQYGTLQSFPGSNGLPVNLAYVGSKNLQTEDEVYFSKMEEGWYSIINPDLALGFSLQWDISIFPFIWYWSVFGGLGDLWRGEAYLIALEPWTSFPDLGLSEVARYGTQFKLKSGETQKSKFKATIFNEPERVN